MTMCRLSLVLTSDPVLQIAGAYPVELPDEVATIERAHQHRVALHLVRRT